jgi:hypothetical protein
MKTYIAKNGETIHTASKGKTKRLKNGAIGQYTSKGFRIIKGASKAYLDKIRK